MNVDNQQNDGGISLNTNRSNRVPALFSHLVSGRV